MPTLSLHRGSAFRDAYRDYKIILDGSEVGRLPRGKTLELAVADGQHSFYAQIDWQKSEELVFDTNNDNLTYEVFSKLDGFRIFFATVFMFIPGSWIGIRPGVRI